MTGVEMHGYFATPPYRPGDDTSEEAARSMAPHVARQRADVLRWLAGKGQHGATADEAEVELGLCHSSAGTRILELWHAGMVERPGARRLTRSGRNARVNVITERGRAWVAANPASAAA